MSAFIAIAHVLGAIVVLFVFSAGVIALAVWENERNRKAALEEMSLALSIPINELDDTKQESTVVQFVAAKFSSELLRNRLSDLCGWIQTIWGWLGILIQVGVLLGVIWYTFTDDLSNSIHAWWIVAIAFFFSISSVLFALTCKLLLGRFPGQARQARKMLADAMQHRRTAVKDNDDYEAA